MEIPENPFARYPHGGRQLLGRPRNLTGASRSGYGLAFQRITGQVTCADCAVSLVDDYDQWLVMQVDHVVPAGEARRLGIDLLYYEDAIDLVLACAGCHGFGNRYRCAAETEPGSVRDIVAFLDLRDRTFADRIARIAERHAIERALFEARPWATAP